MSQKLSTNRRNGNERVFFYRIKEQEMKTLEVYMDSDIREEVQLRFAPCTNEEFLCHVYLRDGIATKQISEVLKVDFWGVVETFMIIETIKGLMCCNNEIKRMKIKYSGRELLFEKSEIGEEYRLYLCQHRIYFDRLKTWFPDTKVLSDLKKDFPEIAYTFIKGYLFYTWREKIV